MEPTAEGGHAPPESFHQPAPPDNAEQPDVPYPAFCRAIFILDPCFGGLRAILIGQAFLRGQPGSLAGVWLVDTVACLLVLIFGTSAAVTMLYRKRWGMGLAAIAVLATLCSVGLGIWEVSLQAAARGQAMFIVGAGCPIVFRLALLIFYVMALFKFEKWSRGQAEPTVLQNENQG